MPADPTPRGEEHGEEHAAAALTVRIGHDEIVIRQRYEVLSIVNDILIAVWFVIGSVLFFGESTATAGTWLFLLGSIQLLIRPVIRLTRRVHVQRVRSDPARPGAARPTDLADDY